MKLPTTCGECKFGYTSDCQPDKLECRRHAPPGFNIATTTDQRLAGYGLWPEVFEQGGCHEGERDVCRLDGHLFWSYEGGEGEGPLCNVCGERNPKFPEEPES